MIIVNGYIQPCTRTSGGVDSIGVPTAATVVWGAYIPCQWRRTSANLQSRTTEGDAYASATLEVLTDCGKAGNGDLFRVYDKGQNLVGEYTAKNIEQLPHVGITRYTF